MASEWIGDRAGPFSGRRRPPTVADVDGESWAEAEVALCPLGSFEKDTRFAAIASEDFACPLRPGIKSFSAESRVPASFSLLLPEACCEEERSVRGVIPSSMFSKFREEDSSDAALDLLKKEKSTIEMNAFRALLIS